MNAAARAVVTEIPDITIAYGVSDEYRQIFSLLCCSLFVDITHETDSGFTALFSTKQLHSSSAGQGMLFQLS